MKSREEKSRREESKRRVEKKSRREKKKETDERRYRCANVRKVAKHDVFPMNSGSGGPKVGSLKRRVRSHVAR